MRRTDYFRLVFVSHNSWAIYGCLRFLVIIPSIIELDGRHWQRFTNLRSPHPGRAQRPKCHHHQHPQQHHHHHHHHASPVSCNSSTQISGRDHRCSSPSPSKPTSRALVRVSSAAVLRRPPPPLPSPAHLLQSRCRRTRTLRTSVCTATTTRPPTPAAAKEP